jgi:hypothetical protein
MSSLDVALAGRFTDLALACVHREYPNKISHFLSSDADVASPRKLTPAFYGCYDWHSAVHNHWLLARLARIFPGAQFAVSARKALQQNLTGANITAETQYLKAPGRTSFERPYGLAWLLQLSLELHEWGSNDLLARELSINLKPLEQAVKEQLSAWLSRLAYPVRSGEHSQTAFALGLMIDYARVRDREFLKLLVQRALDFYGNDENYPLAYEPSGEDFLSSGLAEADAMRRVLNPQEFSGWLSRFLPQLSADDTTDWLTPVKSPDPSDPKFSHLDGLNLSRAWMLKSIASGLSPQDPRTPLLLSCASAHAQAGLAAITGEHYVGSHWLGSFATYLLTR